MYNAWHEAYLEEIARERHRVGGIREIAIQERKRVRRAMVLSFCAFVTLVIAAAFLFG